MQNNNYCAVQGHLRSMIFIPMESLYATSCLSIILTYILSRTISKLSLIIGSILAVNRGVCLSLMHSLQVNP